MSQESHDILKSKKKKDLIKIIADFSVNQIQKNLRNSEKERKIRKLEDEIKTKETQKEEITKEMSKITDQLKSEKNKNDNFIKFEKVKLSIKNILESIQWIKITKAQTTHSIILSENLDNIKEWESQEHIKLASIIIDNINLCILLKNEKFGHAVDLLKHMSNFSFSKAALQKLVLQAKRIFLLYKIQNYQITNLQDTQIPIERITLFQRIATPPIKEIIEFLKITDNDEDLTKIKKEFEWIYKFNHLGLLLKEFENKEKLEKLEDMNQIKPKK
jgi:hypothetical protein